MRLRFSRSAVRFCAFLFLAAPCSAGAEPLRYELAFERPNTHLMDITIHADRLAGPTVEFAMPNWAPGSYFIMNYAVNVQGFQARDPNGHALPWRKTDSQTWRIELGKSRGVTVRYQLYANTLANNEAQLNDRHAFIGGPAVWMYLVGGKNRPIELSIRVPSGWKVATGLEPRDDHTLLAADYDWFADCPIEMSDFAEKTFTVAGTTYHIVVHDIEGRKDFTSFAHDTQKIVATIVPIFAPVAASGGFAAPFREYWFLFHVWPSSSGGLEHLNSTQINFSTDWDNRSPAGSFGNQYDRKLFVTAHEFFHAWNVKRVRPHPLGPFDYSREVHTPSLWISEGLTSYYGALALVRAGLITPEQYLAYLGSRMTKFEQEPGRHERSIEDTSWDTWFRNIKTENNLSNTWYSYYDGGQIVGHLLDFAIRHYTNNRKSLDDWMRLLYQRYALPKPGFEPEDAIRAASEVAGVDMTEFFRRYISGKDPLPYDTFFGYAGIRVEKTYHPEQAWLGTQSVEDKSGRVRIRNVLPGSPAETAGLSRDDVVLAVNGKAVDQAAFSQIAVGRKPGEALRITVLRLGEVREFTATLASDPYATYALRPVEHATKLQKEVYRTWLGLK